MHFDNETIDYWVKILISSRNNLHNDSNNNGCRLKIATVYAFFLKRHNCFEALYTVERILGWSYFVFRHGQHSLVTLNCSPPLFPKGNHDNIVIEGKAKLSRKITKRGKLKQRKRNI